ncbi:glycerate kinase [Paenibacillus sp. IB182496]|uniref:Glycerate kinase n=1 Tax=Paenibacillus sabuli TaxID=2772509 RepID=A0A927GRL9_9BACL|nr:glycerate kinase [Paenibacillus sabuli]MBD2844817.1 glycerate kinase [Paenibacillus sabuli]
MKFVIATDSYKGSLTSIEAGETMADAIREELPAAEIVVVPMADGGEGTVASIVHATGGTYMPVRVCGPLGEPVDAGWGRSGAEPATAVLETASAAGLPMVPEDRRNPLHTTSRGLGELMLDALDSGMRTFIVGLGGSATNDGGMGMLTALGARFTDAQGKALAGYGRELGRVAAVDYAGLDPRLRECRLIAASDVTNPLCGPDGCAHVFGPQKGADPATVAALDEAMRGYAALVEAHLGHTYAAQPGSGAAGGLGFGLRTLGAELVPGAQLVGEAVRLAEHVRGADWVLTGEGMSDAQTLQGKLPAHVAEVARDAGAGCLLLSGAIGADADALLARFDGCFAAVARPAELATCMREAQVNVDRTARSIARLIKRASQPTSQSATPEQP